MKTLQRFRCLFGHDYYLIGRPSERADHVGCRRCGREWGVNHGIRIMVPWHEVAHFYADWGYPASSKKEGGE